MQKNLFTFEKGIDVEVSKTQLDENWIQRLWAWADKNDIDDLEWVESDRYWRGLPRDKKTLLYFKSLTLSCNSLTELPKEIGNLSNLTELDFSWNNLAELPREIGNLRNLTKLNLSVNKLSKLPKEIGECRNLTELNLMINELTELPEEVGKLSNLGKFILSIKDAVEIVGREVNLPVNKQEKKKAILSKIKSFTSSNKKTLEKKLSVKIDDRSMQRLRDWADENNISNELFPRDKNELLLLEHLDLGADDVECDCFNEIPAEIGMLSSLTSLSFCVDGDTCGELPESIGMLGNLTELLISVCHGEVHLPKSVANLTGLELIGLTGNIPIASIELLLQNCESLERLFIDNNQILKTLPKNICDCSSIKELALINNRNLLLTPKQFDWAEKLRDDEKGYDRVYCTELPDGTSMSYTTDYGQKFQFYCIIPFDRSIKIYEPNFPSKEELF